MRVLMEGAEVAAGHRPSESIVANHPVGSAAGQAGRAVLPAVSVVVPAYNEAANIGPLVTALRRALVGIASEILIVDDGSSDDTAARARAEPDVRCVQVEHRGKSAALQSGLALARAAIVVTVDADLQEDLSRLPAMVGRCEEGYDCVTAVRRPRHDPLWTKRIPAWVGAQLIRLLFGRHYRDIGCGLRACRREALAEMAWFDGAHRLVPLLIERQGGSVAELTVAHRRRARGRANFNSPIRLLAAARDVLYVRFGVYDRRLSARRASAPSSTG